MDSQCRLCVDSRALALSAISLRSALPNKRMSIASCLLLSRKLFCIVRVADLAASPAYDRQNDITVETIEQVQQDNIEADY